MKKYFVLSVMASAVFLNSCGSEDEIELITDPVEPRILLSKITTVNYDNPANPTTNVANFMYTNQGEISKIVSEGRTSTFEYDAAKKPVKVNYYNSAGNLEYYSTYTYNGDQLAETKAIYSNPDFNRTTTYTYNNGKVMTSTLCQSPTCSSPSVSTYTYNGDNITVEEYIIGGTLSIPSKREYLYDNQLSPYTYVNKYFKISIGGAYVLSKNNYTTERISYKDNAGNWVQNQHIIYEVIYNSAQLPTQVTGRSADGSSYVKYSYEYIIQ